jgi:hypothetical protein
MVTIKTQQSLAKKYFLYHTASKKHEDKARNQVIISQKEKEWSWLLPDPTPLPTQTDRSDSNLPEKNEPHLNTIEDMEGYLD